MLPALSLAEVVDKAHDDDRLARSWQSFDRLQAGEITGEPTAEELAAHGLEVVNAPDSADPGESAVQDDPDEESQD